MKFTWVLWISSIFVTACSTLPVREKFVSQENPLQLFKSVCSIGSEIQSAEGTVWLKTQSPEVSGQYFADVSVFGEGNLKLEITNLFGGIEASIEVDEGHYEITRKGKRELREETTHGSWGGVPLKWASTLFLGKIPCPPLSESLRVTRGEDGELIVYIPEKEGSAEQVFTYWLSHVKSKPWPAYFVWERKSTPSNKVEVRFDDPEEDSLSPRKWEATSPEGALKTRWRSRNVRWASNKTIGQKNRDDGSSAESAPE